MGGTRQQRNAPNATASRTKKEFKQLRQRKQSEVEECASEREHGSVGSASQFGHRPREIVDERGLPYSQLYTGTNNSGQGGSRYSTSPSPWMPGGYAAFKLIMSGKLV